MLQLIFSRQGRWLTHAQKYRSLTLMKATTTGWAAHHGLNAAEIVVLQHIAVWGVRNQKGLAFVWFPAGMDEWAETLGIGRRRLFRALASLSEKRLVGKVVGQSSDPRFKDKEGYAIPNIIMDEVIQWSDGNVTPSVTETSLVSDESVTLTPPLTCDDSEHTHIQPREENPSELKLRASTSGDSPNSEEEEMPFTYEDDWSAPSDERDDFDRPSDQSPAKTRRPGTRLADHFYEGWLVARQESPMLAVPWTTKPAFLKNLNTMLKDFSEEQIRAMIDVFFRLAVANEVYLGSQELWRDFLSARARCWKILMQAEDESVVATSPAPSSDTTWMHEAKQRREAKGIKSDS